MDLHKNARSCPASRALLVSRVISEGWTVRRAAEAAGISERRAYEWLRRYRREGPGGLEDRCSRPHRCPTRIARADLEEVLRLRAQRLSGAEIASKTGLPRSTVARWLKRSGMGRLAQLAPPEPVRRYEKEHPGELLHLDTKKLGRIDGAGHRVTGDRSRRARGVGWEFVHVAIDDASRLAYVEILDDERAVTAAGFLRRAVTWFAQRGVTIRKILTDNGSCYIAKLFAAACRTLGIRHGRTRPYRPRTNGKAERFIQTLLREWAYAFTFHHSRQRAELLSRYLHFYNHHRSHSALKHNPPISRLNLNNLVRIDS